MGLGSPFTTGAKGVVGVNGVGVPIHDLVLGRSFVVLNCSFEWVPIHDWCAGWGPHVRLVLRSSFE